MADSAFEKFKKPPIKEAVLIINLVDAISPERFSVLANAGAFRSTFPFVRTSIQNSLTLDIGSEKTPPLQKLLDGLVFQTALENPDWVFQIKRTSILVHKIGSYISWDALINQLDSLLPELRTHFHKLAVRDVGIRYINEIPISSVERLQTWFELLPYPLPDLPVDFNNFLLQTGIKKDSMRGLVVESIVSSKNQLNFVIDIRINKPVRGIELDLKALEPDLKQVRDFKNQTFFSLITENLKSTFR